MLSSPAATSPRSPFCSAPQGFTLITGATGGIGRAFAEALAARKHSLFLIDRESDVLEKFAGTLGEVHGVEVRVLAMDLTEPGCAQRIFDHCHAHEIEISTLINNAAVGMHAPFEQQSAERIEEMVRVNILSLVNLTQQFLAPMRQRGAGTIINVSSAGAFDVCPLWSVYAATKAFVQHFTESLQVELADSPIHVALFCPGMTRTNFFASSGHAMPTLQMQTAEEVVAEALAALDRKQQFIVTGRANRIRVHTHRASLRKLLGGMKRGLRRVALLP
jgi:short-subunit dehydrogenase